MPVGALPFDDSLYGGQPGLSTPGTLTSPRVGIDTVVEYGGFFMNYVRNSEKIRVKSIQFSDADVRSAAEPNPQQHGETPQNSYYGGRTVTIDTRIEAFSLERLRDMERALMTGFRDLNIEKPLVFHIDEFDREVHIFCRKSAPIAKKDANDEKRYFRDCLITLRASNPRFLSLRPKFAFWQPDSGAVVNTTILKPQNLGNFGAQLRIVLKGPAEDVTLRNTLTGEFITVEGAIAADDFISLLRFGDETSMVDSHGVSRFSQMSDDSEWFDLLPADEAPDGTGLMLTANGMDTFESRVSVYWNDTWWL